MNDGGCDHICDNDDGSFECHCNDGFLLEEDGLTCLSSNFSQSCSNSNNIICIYVLSMKMVEAIPLVPLLELWWFYSSLP